MSEVYEKLMKCYKSVREKTDFVPEAALVLGLSLITHLTLPTN